MNTNRDYWKIRFGQWFKAALQANGRSLDEAIYFWPDGLELDSHNEAGYENIDLTKSTQAYQTHFDNNLAIPPLSEIAAEWQTTLVLVPGVAHHLLNNKMLQDQVGWLEEQGIKVLYGFYDDSFESVDKCAKRLYETVKNSSTPNEKLVFLGYSKGGAVALELLADDSYMDVRKQTLALVALAGTLRGSPAASLIPAKIALLLLKSYKAHASRIVRKLIRYFSRAFSWIVSWFSPSLGREWRKFLKKVLEFEDEITDLPEGIEGLRPRNVEDRFKNVSVDRSIGLFSLSAIKPPAMLRADSERNPDDFFLYWASRDLYKENIFSDTQMTLPNSHFYHSNGAVHDLGILRSHHWGIALEYVISEKYKNPFPRREMLWALWATLKEYSEQAQAGGPG